MIALALLLQSASAEPPREKLEDHLAVYQHTMLLEQEDIPRRWYKDSLCVYGIPIDPSPDLAMTRRCNFTHYQLPDFTRVERELRAGRLRHRTFLGEWRQFAVREIIRTSDRGEGNLPIYLGGRVLFALAPYANELRVVDYESADMIVCWREEPCAALDHAVIPWTPPAGWEGQPLLRRAHTDHLGLTPSTAKVSGGITSLAAATLETIRTTDRTLLRDRPVPDDVWPDTRFAVEWDFEFFGRRDQDQIHHTWGVQIPLDLLGTPAHFETRFDDLGVTASLDLLDAHNAVLDLEDVRGRHTTLTLTLDVPTAVHEGNTFLDGAPSASPPRERMSLVAPRGLRAVDVYTAHPKLMLTPYEGPDAWTPLPSSTVAQSATNRVVTVDAPLDVRLSPKDRSHHDVLVGHFPGSVEVSILNDVPVDTRCRIYLGERRPNLQSLPDSLAVESHIPTGGSIGFPCANQRVELDREEVYKRGAWIIAEWSQGNQSLLFRAYRLPGGG